MHEHQGCHNGIAAPSCNRSHRGLLRRQLAGSCQSCGQTADLGPTSCSSCCRCCSMSSASSVFWISGIFPCSRARRCISCCSTIPYVWYCSLSSCIRSSAGRPARQTIANCWRTVGRSAMHSVTCAGRMMLRSVYLLGLRRLLLWHAPSAAASSAGLRPHRRPPCWVCNSTGALGRQKR